MKSVSGKTVSSKPISLFKASKILSNFAGVENGASQSVQVFLRRSAAAFEELIQVHKDVKTPQKGEKHHNRRIEIDKRDEDLEKAETSQQLECDLEIGKHKKKHVAKKTVNEEKLEESNERIRKDKQTDVELDSNAEIGKHKKHVADVELDSNEKIEKHKKHVAEKIINVEKLEESKQTDVELDSNAEIRKHKKHVADVELDSNAKIGKHKKHVAEKIINEEKLEESNERIRKDKQVELDERADIERDDVNVGNEKKKKRKTDVKLDEMEDTERDDVNAGKEKKKKKKKKRKNREVDGEELVDHDLEQRGMKKRKNKKRKTDGE